MAKMGPLAVRQEKERVREEYLQGVLQKGKVTEQKFGPMFVLTPFSALRRQAKRLTEYPRAWVVLHRLLQFENQWVRNLGDWKPQGKAIGTLLRGLIRHLLCKYPMPSFWYSVWFDGTEGMYKGSGRGYVENPGIYSYRSTFVQLAQGAGLYKLVQENKFPVALTKKQCHLFMQQVKVNTVTHAARWTQVQSYGGDRRMAETLCETPWGENFSVARVGEDGQIGSRAEEEFRNSVIQWFCNQGMVNPSQIGPLIDYIDFCRAQTANWSICGRTAVSLIRAMETWHAALANENREAQIGIRLALSKPPPEKFESSGIEDWAHSRKIQDSRTGKQTQEHHRVKEILTYVDLVQEGRDLHHCVTSYAWNIARGSTSIWTYSVDAQKTLTLEVHNPTRMIKQIRGLRNRMPTVSEMNYVQKWATEVRLMIGTRTVRGW